MSQTIVSRFLIAAPEATAVKLCDILAVAGAAWCVYDVYNICKVLPEEMALCLNTAIDSCENNYRQETLAKARMLLEKSCAAMDESMKEIAEAE